MVDPVRNKKSKISADLLKTNRISNGVDIEKLALLARIKLTPAEKEKLQKEFKKILDYISQLQKVDPVRGKSSETTAEISFRASNGVDIENVTREDDNPNEPGACSEKLLKEAPSVEKGYIKVKHILE